MPETNFDMFPPVSFVYHIWGLYRSLKSTEDTSIFTESKVMVARNDAPDWANVSEGETHSLQPVIKIPASDISKYTFTE